MQNKSFIQEVGAQVHEIEGGDKRPSESIPGEEKLAEILMTTVVGVVISCEIFTEGLLRSSEGCWVRN